MAVSAGYRWSNRPEWRNRSRELGSEYLNGMKDQMETLNEAETRAFARRLGEQSGPGDVICLSGELGAGKTHFVKGFAEAFDLSPDLVVSPTFTIVHEYPGSVPIYHFDCYRLESVEDALEIGAEEYFYGDGVCIIEWPERITELLPAGHLWISIEITGPESRRITINRQTE